jgi:hypothetical protein
MWPTEPSEVVHTTLNISKDPPASSIIVEPIKSNNEEQSRADGVRNIDGWQQSPPTSMFHNANILQAKTEPTSRLTNSAEEQI